MRQIYHFEDKIPPAVNEQMLRQELEKAESKEGRNPSCYRQFFYHDFYPADSASAI